MQQFLESGMAYFTRLLFMTITPSHFCTDLQHCYSMSLSVSGLMELIQLEEKDGIIFFSRLLLFTCAYLLCQHESRLGTGVNDESREIMKAA